MHPLYRVYYIDSTIQTDVLPNLSILRNNYPYFKLPANKCWLIPHPEKQVKLVVS
jgi:hypothetical protein